jgi:nucleoside-diphosphate-sugar epimerase
MRCVVTGAAGFIGSHLCEYLLEKGHDVVGIDALVPYYAPADKESNLAAARDHSRFEFSPIDLRHDPLDAALDGADFVFHLAAMPGLSQSWTDFDQYMTCNVQATQRLLDALRRVGKPKLIAASTSSVYGRMALGDEKMPTKPISPYGVTKLAAEQLCQAYADAYGLSIVYLRYFSVYGPRQRPDMGYRKFINALLNNQPITVYGDGQQMRGNTFVTDCVEATWLAAKAPAGEIYNVGGGELASVWDVLEKLELLAGRKAQVRQEPARPGDQWQTGANIAKIKTHLGWSPRTSLNDGLARQWAWQEWQLHDAENSLALDAESGLVAAS